MPPKKGGRTSRYYFRPKKTTRYSAKGGTSQIDSIINRYKREKNPEIRSAHLQYLIDFLVPSGPLKGLKHAERKLRRVGETEAANLLASVMPQRELIQRIGRAKNIEEATHWVNKIREEFENEENPQRRRLLGMILTRAENVIKHVPKPK